jgi:hypothetical protein
VKCVLDVAMAATRAPYAERSARPNEAVHGGFFALLSIERSREGNGTRVLMSGPYYG